MDLHRLLKREKDPRGTMHLTDRELEVMALVKRGQKISTIAEELRIHPDTVDFHLRNIRKKAHAQTTLQAVVFFVSISSPRG